MYITSEGLALNLVAEVVEGGAVRLLHIGREPFRPQTVSPDQLPWFALVEVQAAGMDQSAHHGAKHVGSMPGGLLRYVGHQWQEEADGRTLRMDQEGGGLRVTSWLRLYRDLPVVRSHTTVHNISRDAVTLTYVSSFALTGLCKEGLAPWDEKTWMHIPGNSWGGEAQWRRQRIRDLGMTRVEGQNPNADPTSSQNFSMKRVALTAYGTWGSGEYLPMGCVENAETGSFLTWQIEHHAAWHAEVSDLAGQLYLRLSGPTDQENQWACTLSPGESFETVPCSLAWGASFEQTIVALTALRRRIRRPHWDLERLPVIFNDYMNCLYGQPTTEKLLPLIDRAAAVGCEIFCVDCGWYSDGEWWDGVGEWLPSCQRFPGGITEVMDAIRSHGMIPGLWLELEVMGVRCPLAAQWPDECFFLNHGKRVIDHGRYQLDFRHPKVVAHADAVVRRLVEDWGVGYIKMDYNINAGPGTTTGGKSAGCGLLEHARAYTEWLRSVMDRYPDLIVENCSSGGMRMAYSLLSLSSIQSTSDQIDFRKYAAIASAAVTGVAPEQSAVWAYPTALDDEVATAFNMVSAMLFRIHLSGHLARMSPSKLALIEEGIACYKRLRAEIPLGNPFYPLGLAHMEDGWVAYGLHGRTCDYLAVWRAGGSCDAQTVPLPRRGRAVCLYPPQATCSLWQGGDRITLQLAEPYSARLLKIEWEESTP